MYIPESALKCFSESSYKYSCNPQNPSCDTRVLKPLSIRLQIMQYVVLLNAGINNQAADADIDLNGPGIGAGGGGGAAGDGNAAQEENPQPVFTAIELIVIEFRERVDDGWGFDGWGFDETRVLYVLYLRHEGDFAAISDDLPDAEVLAGRTIEEMMEKITRDHNISLEAGLPAPWVLIDRAEPIERVAPLGDPLLMLHGAPDVLGLPLLGHHASDVGPGLPIDELVNEWGEVFGVEIGGAEEANANANAEDALVGANAEEANNEEAVGANSDGEFWDW